MRKEKYNSVQRQTDDNIKSKLSKIPNTVNQYNQKQDNNKSPPLITVANTKRIKSYNNIRDVKIETIPANGKKSTLVLKSKLDKDKVNNRYINCLGEGESTSATQCLDHEIEKDKDLPPKLENSERVTGNQKIPIDNNKEEDINYSHQTNILFTHTPIYKHIAVPVQFNTSNQVSTRNNNKHQSSSRKKQ